MLSHKYDKNFWGYIRHVKKLQNNLYLSFSSKCIEISVIWINNQNDRFDQLVIAFVVCNQSAVGCRLHLQSAIKQLVINYRQVKRSFQNVYISIKQLRLKDLLIIRENIKWRRLKKHVKCLEHAIAFNNITITLITSLFRVKHAISSLKKFARSYTLHF